MNDEYKDKNDTQVSQGPVALETYFERTSKPFYSLIYLLPLIIFYELGTILLNSELMQSVVAEFHLRVVSFVWLYKALMYLGFNNRLAILITPLVVVIILLAWQIASKKPWSFNISDAVPMTLECLLLTIPLIVLSIFFSRALPEKHPGRTVRLIRQAEVSYLASQPDEAGNNIPHQQTEHVAMTKKQNLLVNIVTGIGAGIYEELVFRLILIGLLMILFENLIGLDQPTAVVLSVITSALLFSLHHHIIFLDGRFTSAETFTLARFIFRSFAGIYFAALYALRGFGVVAATHAFYDIIAALLNFTLYEN